MLGPAPVSPPSSFRANNDRVLWLLRHLHERRFPCPEAVNVQRTAAVIFQHILQTQEVLDPLAGVRVATFLRQKHEGLDGPLSEKVPHVGPHIVPGDDVIVAGTIGQGCKRGTPALSTGEGGRVLGEWVRSKCVAIPGRVMDWWA